MALGKMRPLDPMKVWAPSVLAQSIRADGGWREGFQHRRRRGDAAPYRVRKMSGRSECVRLRPPRPAIRNLRPTDGMRSYTVTTTPPALNNSAAIRPAGPRRSLPPSSSWPLYAPLFPSRPRSPKRSRMLRVSEIKLPLDHGPEALKSALLKKLRVAAPEADELHRVQARRRCAQEVGDPVRLYRGAEVVDEADVLRRVKNDPRVTHTPNLDYPGAVRAPSASFLRPVVIGAGPCGLFAALILAQAGYRRSSWSAARWCASAPRTLGGCGASRCSIRSRTCSSVKAVRGTFSDGKLYSQIKDPRHLGRKVLTEFVKAGAPEDILIEAHPHIGTFRLVTMVEHLRDIIEGLGGEYRFGSRVADLDIDEGRQVRGVVLASGERIATNHIVLAPGHSARDVFQMLYDRGVDIEAKPFSIGFRIEHPQSIIDKARYGRDDSRARRGRSTGWCITPRTDARSTASACVLAGRWCGDIRGRPCRDQRHEPVLAQRAQRQRRHRGRNHAARLSRARARRDRSPAQMGVARVRSRWTDLQGAGTARGRFPGAAAFDRTRRGDAIVSARRAPDQPVGLPAGFMRSTRSARPFPRSGGRSRALRWTMRC